MEALRQCQCDTVALGGGIHVLEDLVAIIGCYFELVDHASLYGLIEGKDNLSVKNL